LFFLLESDFIAEMEEVVFKNIYHIDFKIQKKMEKQREDNILFGSLG